MDESHTEPSLHKYRVTRPEFYTRCAVVVAVVCVFAFSFGRFLRLDLRDQLVIGSLAGIALALAVWFAWKRRPTTYIRRVPTATATMSINQIETLTDLNRLIDAEDASRNLIAANPDNHRAYETLARALLQQRRPTEALAAAESSLAIEPSSSHASYLRASAQSGLKKPLRAIASLDQAIEASPTTTHLHVAKARQHLEIGRLGFLNRGPRPRRKHRTLSHDAAQRAVELDPTSDAAIRALAAAKESLGDVDGAMAAYEQSVSLHPENASGVFALGRLTMRNGDLGQGATLLMSAVSLDPSLGRQASQEFIPRSRVYDIAMMAWIITALLTVVWIVMALLGNVGFLRIYLACGVLVGLRGVLNWAKRKTNLEYPPELQRRIEFFQESVSAFDSGKPPPTTVERIS